MRMYDIIKKKRDGEELSVEEIRAFISGYTKGEVTDYQASALLMAIYFRGMSTRETLDLTLAIADSGEKLELSAIKGFKVDKHSSGGVGDKTSLVVMPVVASLGVKVAKMSGRGLGHTGGTVDKLQSIPGFRTDICKEEFEQIVNSTGMAIAGQTASLAPADKKLYALRDVTATVDSEPLIASSIMGKKLAAADDGIVLDVKVGSGSFMKTVEKARSLANTMVAIGNGAGKRTVALLTNMDMPLGRAVGNALEVKEAIDCLNGIAESDFYFLCVELSGAMLYLAGLGDINACKVLAERQLKNGQALAALKTMVKAQHGDESYIDYPQKFNLGKTKVVHSPQNGYIYSMNAEGYGLSSLCLGAGRAKIEDSIDFSAGIEVVKKTGDWVSKGEPIAVLHSSNETLFAQAEGILLSALIFSEKKPEKLPVVFETIGF